MSILLSPPTSAFSGLRRAAFTRDFYSAAVAMAALLAKFTPLFLSNVPFRNTVTWKMHEACTWSVVGVLSYMLLVLLWSFWVRQPCMPIEPTSIAGCLYYVCDSTMSKDFEGLSTVGTRERDRLIRKMQKNYVFGRIKGNTGTWRVGVDYVDLAHRKATWKLSSH
jgi:hypothetical protein